MDMEKSFGPAFLSAVVVLVDLVFSDNLVGAQDRIHMELESLLNQWQFGNL